MLNVTIEAFRTGVFKNPKNPQRLRNQACGFFYGCNLRWLLQGLCWSDERDAHFRLANNDWRLGQGWLSNVSQRLGWLTCQW